MVLLKLKETNLVANSINSTNSFSGNKGTDVKGLQYKKSAQTEITSKRYNKAILKNHQKLSQHKKRVDE